MRDDPLGKETIRLGIHLWVFTSVFFDLRSTSTHTQSCTTSSSFPFPSTGDWGKSNGVGRPELLTVQWNNFSDERRLHGSTDEETSRVDVRTCQEVPTLKVWRKELSSLTQEYGRTQGSRTGECTFFRFLFLGSRIVCGLSVFFMTIRVIFLLPSHVSSPLKGYLCFGLDPFDLKNDEDKLV